MLQEIANRTQTSTITHRGMADCALPFMTFEDGEKYSVVLNLLGVNPKDIFIDVDKSNNEVGVYAGKGNDFNRSVSFWVFGVPADGQVERVALNYKGGGLEVTVPKMKTVHGAA